MSAKIDRDKFTRKLKLAVEDKGDLSKLKTKSLKEMADTLVESILERIGLGVSPITGRRFPSYKNPDKYPGDLKGQRPVNLYLTGQFLSSLITRIKTGKKPTITITFSNQLAHDKESGHRTGANGQPRRPIIPQGSEGFTDGILLAVREVFRKVIDRDLK